LTRTPSVGPNYLGLARKGTREQSKTLTLSTTSVIQTKEQNRYLGILFITKANTFST